MVAKHFEGVQVATGGVYATATFTPAAAAYLAGDVMSVAQELQWKNRHGENFAGGLIFIVGSRLQIAHTAVISGETSYRLPIYNVTPPSAHADNDAWDVPAGDRAAYETRIELGTPVDLGSTLQIDTEFINRMLLVPAGGLNYAELQTVGAFTATAAARKVTLFATLL